MKTLLQITLLGGTILSAGAAHSTPWGTEFTSSNILAQLNAMEMSDNQNTNDITNNADDNTDSVEQKLDEVANSIISALRMSTGESSSYADKQIEAMRRFGDAEQQNETERLRQEIRAEAESGAFDPDPDSCLLAGLFAGDGGSSGGHPGLGTATASSVAAAMSGTDPAVQAGGTALAASVVEAIEPFKGRSDGTVAVPILLEDPTLDMGDEDTKRVVERIVRNAIDPTPPRPITADEMRTPEGVARAAQRQAVLARQQAALELFSTTLNMREPVISSDSFMEYVDQSAYNRDVPDEISELQQLDIRTVRYYAPKSDAGADREMVNDNVLLQRILDVMAINTRIAYISLELQNRQAITDALILATLNDTE